MTWPAVESVRALRVARAGAVKARTQAGNQLRDLIVTAPEQVQQRVPPLRAPRVRDRSAFEGDVVDRTGGEAVAHGQPAVAGTDDHGGHIRRGCASCSLGPGQETLTVTLVGLVRMS